MNKQYFRTIINIDSTFPLIHYLNKSVFIGSCFTELIGQRFTEYKFQTAINPLGVMYNPESVKNSLKILMSNKLFKEQDLFFHDELWRSYYHDTGFAFPDKDLTLNKINKSIEKSSAFLKKADFLFITLGTAWVYKYKENDIIVSNCHKLPSNKFDRFFLSPDAIVNTYTSLIRDIKKYNDKINIIFSISPVRHLKDGATANQRSKSSLILAVYELTNILNDVYYFPAYEIFMDELRDYRFYDVDMVHPNMIATDYIWERFSDAFFTLQTRQLIERVSKITKALKHRPIHPDTKKHKSFLQNNIRQIRELMTEHPYIDFQKELFFLNDKLT
jgi:lysophospholipase L1-like esterase